MTTGRMGARPVDFSAKGMRSGCAAKAVREARGWMRARSGGGTSAPISDGVDGDVPAAGAQADGVEIGLRLR